MSKRKPAPDRMVWIDVETTGLDAGRDLLLEVAVVVTDGQLNELAHLSRSIAHPEQRVLELMGPTVREMHVRSGLLAWLLMGPTVAAPVVEREIFDMLVAHGAVGAVAAGSSVAFDRGFLDVWMRDLNREGLNYRSVDVSGIAEDARLQGAGAVLEGAPV